MSAPLSSNVLTDTQEMVVREIRWTEGWTPHSLAARYGISEAEFDQCVARVVEELRCCWDNFKGRECECCDRAQQAASRPEGE